MVSGRGSTTEEGCSWDREKWEMVETSENQNSHKRTRVLTREQNDFVENLCIIKQGLNHEQWRRKYVTMYTVECVPNLIRN